MKYLDWQHMSKQTKKAASPKLRFPEFMDTEEWAIDSLANPVIASFVRERTPLRELQLEYYISTENLLPDYEGATTASTLPPSGTFTKFQKGDILISNIRPYLKKVWSATMNGAASNDVIVLRAGSFVSKLFLSFLLKNDDFIGYIMKGAKGVKMPRGDKSLIEEYQIAFPNADEQAKIVECLSCLEDLITANSSKLNALKNHKRGMVQQLFPGKGWSTPRMRLPKFEKTGEWIIQPLDTMTSKVGSGITPSGGDKNYKKSGRPFIRSQNVGWGKLLLDDMEFIDEQTHSTFPGTQICRNDVLLNITGASIGRCAMADFKIEGGNVNQHVCIIRTTNNLDPFYLSQYLNSKGGQCQIDSFQAGGNRQGLNFAQIRSFSIPLPPSEQEQKQIAEGLVAMDELIIEQEEKVESLKLHKKGLMQQLFPVNNNLENGK